jgi:ketosteroid isomerase-like protein
LGTACQSLEVFGGEQCGRPVRRREPDSPEEIPMSTSAARSTYSVTTSPQAASAKEIVEQHLRCFSEGDIEGILSDYAPGAIFFTPDGPLRGVEQIRPLFQAMISEFRKPGTVFSMKHQCTEGDYAYILWTAETADNVYELGTDTFVVRDGRIVAQSFSRKITPKA